MGNEASSHQPLVTTADASTQTDFVAQIAIEPAADDDGDAMMNPLSIFVTPPNASARTDYTTLIPAVTPPPGASSQTDCITPVVAVPAIDVTPPDPAKSQCITHSPVTKGCKRSSDHLSVPVLTKRARLNAPGDIDE